MSLTAVDTMIIKAMARTLFLLAWESYQEENDTPTQGEIDDKAPETPLDVLCYGYYVAGQICDINNKSLLHLLLDAAKADHVIGEDYTDSSETVERFGHCLAMQVTGQGVSWFDDHNRFNLRLPHIEFSWMDLDPREYPGKDDFSAAENAVIAAKKSLQEANDAEVLAMVTGKDASEATANIAKARHQLLVALKHQKLSESGKILKADGLDGDL